VPGHHRKSRSYRPTRGVTSNHSTPASTTEWPRKASRWMSHPLTAVWPGWVLSQRATLSCASGPGTNTARASRRANLIRRQFRALICSASQSSSPIRSLAQLVKRIVTFALLTPAPACAPRQRGHASGLKRKGRPQRKSGMPCNPTSSSPGSSRGAARSSSQRPYRRTRRHIEPQPSGNARRRTRPVTG
jgi:hypothetical protein